MMRSSASAAADPTTKAFASSAPAERPVKHRIAQLDGVTIPATGDKLLLPAGFPAVHNEIGTRLLTAILGELLEQLPLFRGKVHRNFYQQLHVQITSIISP